MKERRPINIGWATDSFVPDRPIYLYGQFYTRVRKYVHDPATVTALVIENGGDQAIIVSCDTVEIHDGVDAALRARFQGDSEIDPAKISISATHSHTNSHFSAAGHFWPHMQALGVDSMPEVKTPDDLLDAQEAQDFFIGRIESVIRRAWNARKPGGVSRAQDYAAVGFNRRPQFLHKDGTVESKMYGVCDSPEFIKFEGTVDHTIDMLYTWDMDRNLTGVAVGVPCPSQVMELHYFISADYWHYARKAIRAELGNIYVLPLCEAAGDQNPLDLVQLGKLNHEELDGWNAQAGEVWPNLDPGRECDKIGHRISDAVMRGLEDDTESCICYDVAFAHKVESVSLPIRKVSRADYDEAVPLVKAAMERAAHAPRLTDAEVVKYFEPFGVVERWELQQKTDVCSFNVHFIRIGDTVITTNPFELFVDYSMRIRARAKAPQIFNVQLANGCDGYLPTQAAIDGGSYSSKPSSTTCGPEGGDALVEEFIKNIDELMR